MSAHLLGTFADQPGVTTIEGLDPELYLVRQRDCFVDCRGPKMLTIADASTWGHEVKIITLSHDPRPGRRGAVTPRPVTVRRGAFIGAFATLFNCEIGEDAIVATGTVVRSQDVPARVIVAGNPAAIVALWNADADRFARLAEPILWNPVTRTWRGWAP